MNRSRLVLLTLAVLASSSGCDEPLECEGGACLLLGCEASDPCCSSLSLTPEECGSQPATPDGWDTPPGTGAVFVLNRIDIADAGRGFDLDGKCDEYGCIDNGLWRLGELGNDQLRQGLLGGESLMLIEISGMVQSYRGWDESVTVKIYAARDADDPFFPANNFKVPPGHTECCQFLVHPSSLEGERARVQFAARIRDGHLETLERGEAQIPLLWGVPPHNLLELANAGIELDLQPGAVGIEDGLFSGVWRSRSSAAICNPYCRTISPRCPFAQTSSSSMFDLFVSIGLRPDIDLNGDGIECAYDSNGDGAIDLCCDGAGRSICGGPAVCGGAIVPPMEESTPGSCARNLADGHSIAFGLTAVPASIVGVGL